MCEDERLSIKDVLVPDVGGGEVDVIEILVAVGDTVAEGDGLVTVESDKASMDIPAPFAGTVAEILVKTGDKIGEGQAIAKIEATANASANKSTEQTESVVENQVAQPVATAESEDVLVPDTGGSEVEVIEILVAEGDAVVEGDGLVTVESDKASMDIPAPFTGTVTDLLVKTGDKISEGQRVAKIATTGTTASSASPAKAQPTVEKQTAPLALVSPMVEAASVNSSTFKDSVYAGPAVRRIAREFGVDLTQIQGTGEKNRITKGDVQKFVQQRLQQDGSSFVMPQVPAVDFAKFGEVDIQPLSKINKLTGTHLHRNWITVPHVTQFEEADITDMEAFRQANKKIAEKQGVKLTPIVFVMKAVVAALKQYPRFNASLDASGENLVMKKYYNLGVAVDTPNGLVVPVIRDVDQKGLLDLAKELGAISKKAREKGLSPTDMQGSCFAISSLGGIGGTAFTPIVNAPDVAILGLSKSSMKPVWQNDEFVPRLMLPLSLSYDHRVIDGADGARFITFLSSALSNAWQMVL